MQMPWHGPQFLSRHSEYPPFLLHTGVGVVGAVVMLWFWWYSGIPLPGVVASGLVLGYLLASVLVTIPAVHRFLIDKPAPGEESALRHGCFDCGIA